jgi:GH25 family lysozyme M1 (1,4-beta-N-acetylmuramidase)
MWQYSWKGKIDGIIGDVDLNYCYKDYPSIIKKAGLNGYQKQE